MKMRLKYSNGYELTLLISLKDFLHLMVNGVFAQSPFIRRHFYKKQTLTGSKNPLAAHPLGIMFNFLLRDLILIIKKIHQLCNVI
ncbi:hypothetical protein H8E88_34905 [candidate division KSB1 bacterium]|nr:hypothetical protein [candidate division KSB1 bacterium]